VWTVVSLLFLFVSLSLDAGLLARSQYPESPATGHLDTANAETVPKFPSRHYTLLMQPSPLKFPSYLSYILRVK
jgi:hypothetical protein